MLAVTNRALCPCSWSLIQRMEETAVSAGFRRLSCLHLLLAVARSEDATQFFAEVDLDELVRFAEDKLMRSPKGSGETRYSKNLKRAFESSDKVAEEMGSLEIHVTHVLLGLLRAFEEVGVELQPSLTAVKVSLEMASQQIGEASKQADVTNAYLLILMELTETSDLERAVEAIQKTWLLAEQLRVKLGAPTIEVALRQALAGMPTDLSHRQASIASCG